MKVSATMVWPSASCFDLPLAQQQSDDGDQQDGRDSLPEADGVAFDQWRAGLAQKRLDVPASPSKYSGAVYCMVPNISC
jgi:hypothetical protein